MALGKRIPVQQPLFISTVDLNIRPHPFYEAVNKVLDSHHFDTYAEDLCAKFYADEGRPEMGTRSYASEPNRGRQTWDGQADAQAATYANRRRVKGERGKELLRGRGEKLERTFAHCYETGAMRHLYLRGRENIAKRVLIHAAGCNIGIMMRLKYGLRKPRSHSGGGFSPYFGLGRLLSRGLEAFDEILMSLRAIQNTSSTFQRIVRSSLPLTAA